MSCNFDRILSVGDYTEYRTEYGTAYYEIDKDGDWITQNDVEYSGDSDMSDAEFEPDHFECSNCNNESLIFDCETSNRVDGEFCCVMCHTWNDYQARFIDEPVTEPEPVPEPVQEKLTEQELPDNALAVVEALLKGVK
jgi:hypothetical protein